jgi:FkbM family methyltransferase
MCYPGTEPSFPLPNQDYEDEDRFMRALSEAIKAGDHYIDAGSHFGLHAIMGALACGPTGRVTSFEPAPETFSLLEKNIRMNGLEGRISAHQAAVSDKAGTAILTVAGTSRMNTLLPVKPPKARRTMPRSIEVRTVVLDDFLDPGRRNIVKIDVEGAEIVALRGAQRLLHSDARIFVELHPWAWNILDSGWAEFQDLCRRSARMPVLGDEELKFPAHCRVELAAQT